MDFTGSHVQHRMQQRGITATQAQACVNHGRCVVANGRRVYDDGSVRVVARARDHKVITVVRHGDVHRVDGVPWLGAPFYQKLHRDTGVLVLRDQETGVHEVHGAGNDDGMRRVLHALGRHCKT